MDENREAATGGQRYTDRRGFLKTVVLAGTTLAMAGIPLAAYFVSPALEKGGGRWVDFGAVADLNDGETAMLSFEYMVKDGWQVLPQRGFVWARRGPGEAVKVMSSTCTHLACNVIWKPERQVFECPCHTGIYDAEGRPISGPPARPLAVLEHKIEDGKLQVYLTA